MTHGSLEHWSQAANMLFASGCEAQSFALLAAMGSPLLPLIKTKGPGFGTAVSIHGGKKSGKTTIAAACRSVWGEAGAQGPTVDETLINRDPAFIRESLEDGLHHEGHVCRIVVSGMALPVPKPFTFGAEFETKVPSGLIVPKSRVDYDFEANSGHAGAAIDAFLSSEDSRKWSSRRLTSAIAAISEKQHVQWPRRNIFALRAVAIAYVAGLIGNELKLIQCDPERIRTWAIGNTPCLAETIEEAA